MADVTQLTFVGDWRVTVQSRDASWGQRVSVQGAAAGNLTLAGTPGAAMDVYGSGQTPWTLIIEHDDSQHGWQPSWLRATSALSGARYEWLVESEDTTKPTSDRDFNDLVIRLNKLGMVAQPVPPFAVRPSTLQAMPEGVFEATLGRYFMAVQMQNIWTLAWPSSARVGLTDRCRAWLAASGVHVIDAWSVNDQAAVGQAVSAGRVAVGALQPWETRRIYFKVDVAHATVRKHQVELQVMTDQGPEELALVNKKARAPISVSRTTFDSSKSEFVSRSDVGTLTASIKEMVIDMTTFKRALALARRLGRSGGQTGGSGGTGGPLEGCDLRTLQRVRDQLRAFLDGKEVDLCALWRLLACCCAGGHGGGNGGDDWTDRLGGGLDIFVWPTVVDYTVDYRSAFDGQFGPIPFEDPLWKALLIILAIILTIAAVISGGTDLAAHSDSLVIGTLTRSVLNPLPSMPATNPLTTDPGSVDAAVVTLNGKRGLTSAIFSYLDAASGEATTTPMVSLGGLIDTPGSILTNAQITALFQNLAHNPTDPAARSAMRAFKSGARSGFSGAFLLSMIVPVKPRTEHDGSTVFFLNQIMFMPDAMGAAISCPGDSGSIWLQTGTNAVLGLNHAGSESGDWATACRIEDVLMALGIRFA